jgi:hypothetical protein
LLFKSKLPAAYPAGDVVNNVTNFVEHPNSYEALFEKLEDKFCTAASTMDPTKKPASIVGKSNFALLS